MNQLDFSLDPRLQADTLPVLIHQGCAVRLMNDRRWPWLIIAPQIAGAGELQDLDPADRTRVLQLTVDLGAALKRITGCEKLNTAAIGNIVRQVHIHVVARSENDANWPGPVWGFGTAEPYPAGESDRLIAEIIAELKD